MPKLMPSLRHTKSEEHLDSTITASPQPAAQAGDIDGTHASSNVVVPITAGANVKIHIEKAATATHLQVGSLPAEPTTTHREWNEHGMTEDDVWSQEDDEITAQYLKLHKMCEKDAVSQMSLDSIDSREQSKWPSLVFSVFYSIISIVLQVLHDHLTLVMCERGIQTICTQRTQNHSATIQRIRQLPPLK